MGVQQGRGTAWDGGLLERSQQLSALHKALAASGDGLGFLVLLAGEAGGGKTALLRQFFATTDPVRPILWSSCDPLFTPRPLGPFIDIAQECGGDLGSLVGAGARVYQVAAALVNAAQERPGTVIVLEDLHWADEATLDVLSLLGRRIETIPALVIATYRDDELDRTHPLRRILGELRNTTSTCRLTVGSLSPGAVSELAAPAGPDPDTLYRATAGNPFFVTEVIAAPSTEIPLTVRDAVLARAARFCSASTAHSGGDLDRAASRRTMASDDSHPHAQR